MMEKGGTAERGGTMGMRMGVVRMNASYFFVPIAHPSLGSSLFRTVACLTVIRL